MLSLLFLHSPHNPTVGVDEPHVSILFFTYTYIMYPISICSVMMQFPQLGSFNFFASLLYCFMAQYGNVFLKSNRAHCHNVKCKLKLHCDLLAEKGNNISQKSINKKQPEEANGSQFNKVNKGSLFHLISSTHRQTVREILALRFQEADRANALRGLITAFVCKYVFKCVCPYGRV